MMITSFSFQKLKTNMTSLEKSSKELLEFITELAKALEDRKITWREGIKLTPEFIGFVSTLNEGDKIVEEWKALSNDDKQEIVYDAIVSLKEKVTPAIFKLRLQQLEKVINIIGEVENAIQIEKEIKQLKLQ